MKRLALFTAVLAIAAAPAQAHSTGGKKAAKAWTLGQCAATQLPGICMQTTVKAKWYKFEPGAHLTLYTTRYKELHFFVPIKHTFCVVTEHGKFNSYHIGRCGG